MATSTHSVLDGLKNIKFGEKCIVSWWPWISSAAFKISFVFRDWSYMTDFICPGFDDGVYQYSEFTLPIELVELIPNDTYANISVILYSYTSKNESKQCGTDSASFIATVPENIVPKINQAVISVNNLENTTIQGWGLAIAGYSKLHVDVSASGSYGSTIKAFHISGADTAYLAGQTVSYDTNIITSSGEQLIKVTCTDSRDRTSEIVVSNKINFIAYSPPMITKASAEVVANTGQVSVIAAWNFDSVQGHNSTVASLYYKKSTSTNWILYNSQIQNNVPIYLTLPTDGLISYNFRVIVTDLLQTTNTKETFVSTMRVLLDFKAGGRGLGVGKICETDTMEVGIDAKFFGKIYVDNGSTDLDTHVKELISAQFLIDRLYPVGTIYITIEGSKTPAQLFGGSWAKIEDRVLVGSGSIFVNGTMGGEKDHELTVAEMPRHNHGLRSNAADINYRLTSHGDINIWPINYDANGLHNGLVLPTGGNASLGDGHSIPHNNMPPYLTVNIWKRIG